MVPVADTVPVPPLDVALRTTPGGIYRFFRYLQPEGPTDASVRWGFRCLRLFHGAHALPQRASLFTSHEAC